VTDAELNSLAAAFRGVIEEQAVTFRAQLASLQARLDDEIVKSTAHRLYESEARQRMATTLADAVGDAVVPHLRQLQQRTVALEQRAVPTEAAS
jgi:hypothetical protein